MGVCIELPFILLEMLSLGTEECYGFSRDIFETVLDDVHIKVDMIQ